MEQDRLQAPVTPRGSKEPQDQPMITPRTPRTPLEEQQIQAEQIRDREEFLAILINQQITWEPPLTADNLATEISAKPGIIAQLLNTFRAGTVRLAKLPENPNPFQIVDQHVACIRAAAKTLEILEQQYVPIDIAHGDRKAIVSLLWDILQRISAESFAYHLPPFHDDGDSAPAESAAGDVKGNIIMYRFCNMLLRAAGSSRRVCNIERDFTDLQLYGPILSQMLKQVGTGDVAAALALITDETLGTLELAGRAQQIARALAALLAVEKLPAILSAERLVKGGLAIHTALLTTLMSTWTQRIALAKPTEPEPQPPQPASQTDVPPAGELPPAPIDGAAATSTTTGQDQAAPLTDTTAAAATTTTTTTTPPTLPPSPETEAGPVAASTLSSETGPAAPPAGDATLAPTSAPDLAADSSAAEAAATASAAPDPAATEAQAQTEGAMAAPACDACAPAAATDPSAEATPVSPVPAAPLWREWRLCPASTTSAPALPAPLRHPCLATDGRLSLYIAGGMQPLAREQAAVYRLPLAPAAAHLWTPIVPMGRPRVGASALWLPAGWGSTTAPSPAPCTCMPPPTTPKTPKTPGAGCSNCTTHSPSPSPSGAYRPGGWRHCASPICRAKHEQDMAGNGRVVPPLALSPTPTAAIAARAALRSPLGQSPLGITASASPWDAVGPDGELLGGERPAVDAVGTGLFVVLGGRNAAEGDLASSEVYREDQAAWAPTGLPAMSAGRSHFGAVRLQDTIYVLGGWRAEGSAYLAGCERLDLGAQRWVPVAPLPRGGRAHMGVCTQDGVIYAAGGRGVSGVLDTAERYDPRMDRWQSICRLPSARASCACVSLSPISGPEGPCFYALGGITAAGAPLGSVLRWEGRADRWVTEKAGLRQCRGEAAAAVVAVDAAEGPSAPGVAVHLVGGFDMHCPLCSIERFECI
ncbi:hypothetical protein PAPYR_4986 [Paratrimastix pyriformis]|uniref:Uncharacterized protein n=1 Tax=Paratrimastix pyriformis TaxID=342808 RepID=A0ABQ8UMG0_9EUKA|nr:hypothetical protein PAPYR_4986 [Paratrimastix pyriformis]